MSKKNEPGGRGRIPFLLRSAFAAAERGDRDAAMALWEQAIREGYVAHWRTKRQLMYRIGEAEKSAGNREGPVAARGNQSRLIPAGSSAGR